MSQELPEKWKMMSIGEIAKVYNGNSINKVVKQTKYTGLSEGRNFIATKDVAFDGTVTYENGVKIPFEETQYKIAPADSVFVCSEGGSAGRKTAYITQEVCFGNKLYAIVKNHDLYFGKYIYYFTRSQLFFKQFQRLLNGIIGGVNNKNFATIQIPVPPIEEQRRIVTRIEELFSELDSAVETLQKTRQQLEVYRQAVLKEAFDGLNESVTMDTLAVMIDPQPSHRTPAVYDGGIPYIGIGDIDYSCDRIKFSEARKVSPDLLEEHRQRYRIEKGDFIMGKIGTIGKPYRLPLPQDYLLSANVILIKPDCSIIIPDFLYWQFSSWWITSQLIKGSTATSQPAFGIKKARLLNIKICGMEKQKQIVNQIYSKLSICDSIEKTINEALQQAEAMRQSILKKAFEGRL